MVPCEIVWPYSKIDSTQQVLSRLHDILVSENWDLSDPDPKWIIPDPDPANNSGIHNTDPHCLKLLASDPHNMFADPKHSKLWLPTLKRVLNIGKCELWFPFSGVLDSDVVVKGGGVDEAFLQAYFALK